MIHFTKPETQPNARRVLVIDDEPSFTRMIKLNLEAKGDYIVETLNQSGRAYELARDFSPDIILLDVVMPGADGGDVAAALRKRSATKAIPIIFVSAMVSRKETHSGFYESGGEHFMSKPVECDLLCGAIEKVLCTAKPKK